MAGSPWTAGSLAGTMAMWTVMMAAMMVPASLPVMRIVLHGSRAATSRGEPSTPVAAFTVGYLLVWAAFSAFATLLQAWLGSAMALSGDMALTGARARGAVLLLAGVWQLTPWKHACLSHCRVPLSFALHRWRSGLAGALRMGADHGLSCVGCCWALMLVLFATGVMNLYAVVALTVLVIAERTFASGRAIGFVTGLALVAWGLVTLFT